jgi:broad specificity phosphatase PhoE
MGDLILLRHGETEWSLAGKHTGRTDLPLTPRGEAAAAALAPLLARRHLAAAFTSPAQRALRTAALAGLAYAKPDPDLWEWDYGGYEGLTTQQIGETRPGWYLWRDGVIPGDAEHPGETVEQVGERADQVLGRVTPLLADGDVALVAHGHVLRVLTARYLRLEPTAGRLFRLDTGTISTLGTEHAEPVITSWNVPPPAGLVPQDEALVPDAGQADGQAEHAHVAQRRVGQAGGGQRDHDLQHQHAGERRRRARRNARDQRRRRHQQHPAVQQHQDDRQRGGLGDVVTGGLLIGRLRCRRRRPRSDRTP